MKLDKNWEKKVSKAILEITELKIKYMKIDTMFIARQLDAALKVIGWAVADMLVEGKKKKRKMLGSKRGV